ncbi:MAG: hemerythrin domain-containing protein [Acidimicrobiales bacterium]
MPDVFTILTNDHRRVESLFSQFEQGGDPEVAQQICDELTVHAMVEEELVYPVLASKAGYQGLAQEARREHDEARQLVEQIDAGASRGDDVSGLARQLKESIQHHVQVEESELFPKLGEKVPALVEHMGDDVLERKKALEAQVREARSLGMPSRVVPARPSGA